jgi:hypothetical protein
MEIHPIKIFLMDGSPVHQNLVGWRSIDQKVDWMDDGLDGLDGYPFWVHPLGALPENLCNYRFKAIDS